MPDPTGHADVEQHSRPTPSDRSLVQLLPAYLGGLTLISLTVFFAVIVSYDGGCTEAAECDGDGELTGLVAAVYGVIAFALGLVVVAVIELGRAIRRQRTR